MCAHCINYLLNSIQIMKQWIVGVLLCLIILFNFLTLGGEGENNINLLIFSLFISKRDCYDHKINNMKLEFLGYIIEDLPFYVEGNLGFLNLR